MKREAGWGLVIVSIIAIIIGALATSCQERHTDLTSQPVPTPNRPAARMQAMPKSSSDPNEIVLARICFRHGDLDCCLPIPMNAFNEPREFCLVHYEPRRTDEKCMIFVRFRDPIVESDWSLSCEGFKETIVGHAVKWIGCLAEDDELIIESELHKCKIVIRPVYGDVRGDGIVNAADRIDVRNAVGSSVTAANARCDVDTDGAITARDRWLVEHAVGSSGSSGSGE